MFRFILCTLAILTFVLPGFAGVIYVDDDSTASVPNGESWATSYPYLQDAIAHAAAGDEIRVAGGSYFPDQGVGHTLNNRSESFRLKGDVSLIGSYLGLADPSHADERDLWNLDNISILFGDIGTQEDYSDNSYVLLKCEYPDANLGTVLDGFEIAEAYNDIGGGNGAGILINDCEPTIRNCFIVDNHAPGTSDNGAGGGIYVTRPAMEVPLYPTVEDCWLLGNTASSGAGVEISVIEAKFDNVYFDENIATKRGGGASVRGSNALFTNCEFYKNEVDAASPNLNGGGGLFADGINLEPNFRNCLFRQNVARNSPGGGATADFTRAAFIRCTFWHNKSIAEELPLDLPINPGNVPGGRGGGIYGGDEDLVDCVFHGNTVWDAEEEGEITGNGSGIYVRKFLA